MFRRIKTSVGFDVHVDYTRPHFDFHTSFGLAGSFVFVGFYDSAVGKGLSIIKPKKELSKNV